MQDKVQRAYEQVKLDNLIKNPTEDDLKRSLKNKKDLNNLLDRAIK